MGSKLDGQIDTIMDAYNDALIQIAVVEGDIDAAQQRLDDLDELRTRLKNKRGQDGDIVSAAVVDIARKDSKRAGRLTALLGLE